MSCGTAMDSADLVVLLVVLAAKRPHGRVQTLLLCCVELFVQGLRLRLSLPEDVVNVRPVVTLNLSKAGPDITSNGRLWLSLGQSRDS